jgi:ABC-type Fe3+-hydroxamate transport system substrate-binding protein
MIARSFSDQLGNRISLHGLPQRIVSLVPSQTELLSYLGLDECVVGITKFCVHPPDWRQRKAIIGGTKKFRFDIVEMLKPDLIIGNKEENYRSGIERLSRDFPLWMSDIITFRDALTMIESVGSITGKQPEAIDCVNEIKTRFEHVKKYDGQSVLYLIWKDPWMAAGRQTFIDTMLSAIGLKNVLEAKDRYPVLSMEDVQKLTPRYIFLSSEPYPFTQNHAEDFRRLTPHSKVMLVDGEMFSWYGSRLIKAAGYFNTLDID